MDTATAQGQSLTSRLDALGPVLQQWRQLAAPAFLQSTLDPDTAQVASDTAAISHGRKTLSEHTRAYTQLATSEEKLGQIGPLVTAYQRHIDELGKRLRYADQAHVRAGTFIRSVIDADPTSALDRAVAARGIAQELAQGAQRESAARRALAEREAELSGLTNQEVTIEELREELREAQLLLSTNQSNEAAATSASEELASAGKEWAVREAALLKEAEAMASDCRRLQRVAQDLEGQLVEQSTAAANALQQREQDVASLGQELYELQQRAVLAEAMRDKKTAEVAHLSEELRDLQEQHQRQAAEHQRHQQQQNGGSASAQQGADGFSTWGGAEPASHQVSPSGHTTSATAKTAGSHDVATIAKQLAMVQQQLQQAEQMAASERGEFERTRAGLTSSLNDHAEKLALAEQNLSAEKQRLVSVLQESGGLRKRVSEMAEVEQRLRNCVLDLQKDLSRAEKQFGVSLSTIDVATVIPSSSSAAFDHSSSHMDTHTHPHPSGADNTPTVARDTAHHSSELPSMSSTLTHRTSVSTAVSSAVPPTTIAAPAGSDVEAWKAQCERRHQSELLALTAQRDKLKQRVGALEESAAQRVAALEQELVAQRVQSDQLLHHLRVAQAQSATAGAGASSLSTVSGTSGAVPSSIAGVGGLGLGAVSNAGGGFQPGLQVGGHHGGGDEHMNINAGVTDTFYLNRSGATTQVTAWLDRGAGVVARLVLSHKRTRRLFVGYLAVIHIVLLLVLLWSEG